MTVSTSATLADLVIEDSRRARVLEGFGLDYCCNGQRSLEDSVSEAAVDLGEVMKALDLTETTASESGNSQDRAALAHNIVDAHHAYMWEEMPRLEALVDKVHRVHGDGHPELAKVTELFSGAVAALDPHMTKEEHTVVGDLFKEINSLTANYAVPEDSCASYRAISMASRK